MSPDPTYDRRSAVPPELHSLVVTFTPAQQFDAPREPHRMVHAAIHRLIESINPVLSQAIHDAAIKPLVIGPLMQQSPVGAEKPLLFVSVSSLNMAVADVLLAIREKASTRSVIVSLNGEPCLVQLPDCPPAQPGFSLPRATTYAVLLAEASPKSEITLQFTSPTVFRNKGRNFTDPDPRRIFESLARRWHAFAAEPLPDRSFETIPSAVTLKHQETTVEKISLGARLQPGFVGAAQFEIGGDDDFKRAMSALAGYAEFSGIGARTAFGMGQTQRLQ